MANRKRSDSEISSLVEKIQARVKGGESITSATKAEGVAYNNYYNWIGRLKKAKKIAKKVLKVAPKKAPKKSIKKKVPKTVTFNPTMPEEVSFKELDNKAGRTMVIVTNDSNTVASILLAAFGREA